MTIGSTLPNARVKIHRLPHRARRTVLPLTIVLACLAVSACGKKLDAVDAHSAKAIVQATLHLSSSMSADSYSAVWAGKTDQGLEARIVKAVYTDNNVGGSTGKCEYVAFFYKDGNYMADPTSAFIECQDGKAEEIIDRLKAQNNFNEGTIEVAKAKTVSHRSLPPQEAIDPDSPKQQMDWVVNKLANGGGNCSAIATNIRTYMNATGSYDSPQISKMLYTARKIGCI